MLLAGSFNSLKSKPFFNFIENRNMKLKTMVVMAALVSATSAHADWDMPFFDDNDDWDMPFSNNNDDWDMPFFDDSDDWDMPFFGDDSDFFGNGNGRGRGLSLIHI